MKSATQSHSSIAETGNAHTFARNGNSTNAVNMSARCLVGRPARPTADIAKPATHQWLARKPSPSIRKGIEGALSGPVRREFLPVAAGRSEAAAGLPGHAASENEVILFFCIKGRGWCEMDGARYEITPGQLLIFPAKLERNYSTYAERLWSLIWIQLVVAITDASVVKLNATPHTISLGASERAHMIALFQDVLHALEMPCQQRLQQLSQRAAHFLDGVIPNQRESCAVETNVADKISRTVEYMKEHLNEPLRAATLAGIANMSLPHYFAQFKRVIGSSPIDYLIKLRMDHARRLLSETSWSVKEVAVSLGYDDPLYFSRVFKSINQTAPTNFRAKKRNIDRG
jgi:AraC-like DNA-binding protein